MGTSGSTECGVPQITFRIRTHVAASASEWMLEVDLLALVATDQACWRDSTLARDIVGFVVHAARFMSASSPTLIALLHGPDQPGLVARVAGWIFERGGNILHADQHRDMEAGVFFQRVEWEPAMAGAGENALAVAEADFTAFARSKLGMHVRVLSSADRPRVAVFVSKADHCFHDLVLRWKSGDYACDLVGVVSNHTELAEAARGYGLPFVHIPVTSANKVAAEAKQLALLKELRAELVILARYMQVLSADFLAAFGAPVINIHHSFLPAFAGGRPYHQAHARGVKLIGATAHYATRDLDEGPIIHQDVARVTHRHDVEDLVRKGRDLERLVLAQAVRWHLEGRVLVYGNKTVVFD
jgi:formyltetrahydrofolate deformylase